jgi:ribosomal-protein-alanine N-acetyltransferase
MSAGSRDATLADLDALMALERACFPPEQAYARAEVRALLAAPRAVNLLIEPDVAFLSALHDRRAGVGHIVTVNVRPDARRRGHARALVAEAERRLAAAGAARVVLEVHVGNAGAIALYESLGYERVGGRVEDYYAGYQDNAAWRYGKSLRVVA